MKEHLNIYVNFDHCSLTIGSSSSTYLGEELRVTLEYMCISMTMMSVLSKWSYAHRGETAAQDFSNEPKTKALRENLTAIELVESWLQKKVTIFT